MDWEHIAKGLAEKTKGLISRALQPFGERLKVLEEKDVDQLVKTCVEEAAKYPGTQWRFEYSVSSPAGAGPTGSRRRRRH